MKSATTPTITKIEIFKLNVPLSEPFIISLETILNAENIIIRIHTNSGLIGSGECSPYKSIAGESQGSAFEVAKILAKVLLGQNALAIVPNMTMIQKVISRNNCIKSAFDGAQ